MSAYWDGDGTYQWAYEQLNKLIPAEGSVHNVAANPALERLREAANCYYDLYNNGLCNRARQFYAIFGFSGKKITNFPVGGSYWEQMLDRRMDLLIIAACMEQGIPHRQKAELDQFDPVI